jgi:aspartyl-tRNA(Asn)/glutamyl-tRNA(Gln) amidotransferase subunit A
MPVAAEFAFAPLTRLARELRAGTFTSVELAEFFLERLARLGPKCNAVCTLCRELALADARKADENLRSNRDRGPLHGMPIGLKDLLNLPGYPTTWGAPAFQETERTGEATVVRKLREAGAVVVAKLAMIEMAGGLGYRQGDASWTGPARNPWNTEMWAGGSSSGSGAAVAAGLVPAAIGSETWGSILTPASYCGITGYRPTYGLVSRAGAMALSWTMDKIGPLTRTAADAAAIIAVIAGQDADDPSTVAVPFEPVQPPFDGPFRIARLVDPSENVRKPIRENFEKALEILGAVGEILPVQLPDLPYSTAAGTTIACEMAAAYEPLIASGAVWEMTAPEDRPGAHAAQFIPARDYINAQRIRAIALREMNKALEGFDAIVAPATATVAVPLGQDFSMAQIGARASQLGAASNLCGLPGLFLPTGFDPRGLPTSMQIVGRPFSDAKLLALGQAYQARTNWHEKSPEGWN